MSSDGLPLSDSAATSGTVLASSDYLVDRRTGKITIGVEPPQGYCTLAVQYAAGFEDNADDIPAYVRQAAIAAAVYITHQSPWGIAGLGRARSGSSSRP